VHENISTAVGLIGCLVWALMALGIVIAALIGIINAVK
jgi:hypothetical protein